MGRDLRQIGGNRTKYPDRCYLYDKNYLNGNNEVQPDVEPICRFYKKDAISFQWQKISLGNGSFSQDNHFIGTIETLDHVEQARVGMYVKDQTGMLFVIDSALDSDDANESKVVGTRPAIKTRMILRGVEKVKSFVGEGESPEPPTPTIYYDIIVGGLSHIVADTANPTSVEAGRSATLKFSAEYGYKLPGIDKVVVNGNATSSWDKSTGELVLSNVLSNITISIFAEISTDTFAIITDLQNVSAYGGNPSRIAINDEVILYFEADEGYNLPTDIQIDGVEQAEWTQNTGALRLVNATRDVHITINAIPKLSYTITPIAEENVTPDEDNPTHIVEGGTVSLYFTADDGYYLPATISVTNATYIWQSTLGRLILREPTGNITYSIIGQEILPTTYNISIALLTGVVGVQGNPTTINEDGSAVLRFTASAGYRLPDASGVTVLNASMTWEIDGNEGVLTISNPISNVSVSVVGIVYPKLNAPIIGISANQYFMTIQAVENAEEYDIYVDNVLKDTIDASVYVYDLRELNVSLGQHTIKAKATATGYQDSDFSESKTFTKMAQLSTPTLTLNGDTLTISSVEHAERYLLTLYHDGTQEQVYPETLSVNLLNITSANINYTIKAKVMASGYVDSEESTGVSYTKGTLTITYNLTGIVDDPTLPTIVEKGQGEIIDFELEEGYEFPENITVTGLTGYQWDSHNGRLLTGPIYNNVTITIVGKSAYSITYSELNNCTADSSNPSSVDISVGEVDLKFYANSGYTLTQDCFEISNVQTATWNATTNTLHLYWVMGDVVIKVNAIEETIKYPISVSTPNATPSQSNPDAIAVGEEVTLVFTANSGYHFSLSQTPIQITSGTGSMSYSLDRTTLTVRLQLNPNEPDAISLVVNAVEDVNHSLTINLVGMTFRDTPPSVIEESETISISLGLVSGYYLPSANDIEITNAEFTWSPYSFLRRGTLNIKNATGNVVVNVVAKVLE